MKKYIKEKSPPVETERPLTIACHMKNSYIRFSNSAVCYLASTRLHHFSRLPAIFSRCFSSAVDDVKVTRVSCRKKSIIALFYYRKPISLSTTI
jgi:hypothetical protein